jgi:hypothetical protein
MTTSSKSPFPSPSAAPAMPAPVPATPRPPLAAAGGPEPGRQCDAICPRCGSGDLAKVKGCVVCLQCHYKQDCNGW